MSGIYLGILSLVAGSILVTMTILADTTFPKGDAGTTGRSSEADKRREALVRQMNLAPPKWVDEFQRLDWLLGAGGIAAMGVGFYLIHVAETKRKAAETS